MQNSNCKKLSYVRSLVQATYDDNASRIYVQTLAIVLDQMFAKMAEKIRGSRAPELHRVNCPNDHLRKLETNFALIHKFVFVSH